jgi:small multidrug resistance pump
MTRRSFVSTEKGTVMQRAEAARTSAWLLLGCAVALETAGVIGLRYSEGFTVALPGLAALAAFALALYLVSRVMVKLPVSVAYPVWAGGGTAGVVLIGIAVLGEELTAAKAIGVALVIAGVVVVNRVSEKTGGC